MERLSTEQKYLLKELRESRAADRVDFLFKRNLETWESLQFVFVDDISGTEAFCEIHYDSPSKKYQLFKLVPVEQFWNSINYITSRVNQVLKDLNARE